MARPLPDISLAQFNRIATEASHADISYEDWQAGQATANMSAKAARWRDNVKYGIM